jgi:hypothetical protein
LDFHFASYAIIILSAVAFLIGLLFAALGLPIQSSAFARRSRRLCAPEYCGTNKAHDHPRFPDAKRQDDARMHLRLCAQVRGDASPQFGQMGKARAIIGHVLTDEQAAAAMRA